MQNILRINFAGKVLRCFAGSWLFYTKKQKMFGGLNKFIDEKLTDSPENLQNAETCLLERVHRKNAEIQDFAVNMHNFLREKLCTTNENKIFLCIFSNWHGICMYICKEIRQRKAEKKIEGGTFMAKEYMKRIEALRQQYLATRVDMDVYNAKYLTEGFRVPVF